LACGFKTLREGWHGEDHMILYDESESSAASERYRFAQSFPGFELLGSRGWDDFIVRDAAGVIFTVPTVPLDRELLEPFQLVLDGIRLEPDPRFIGKIKWYVKPIIFGGDPSSDENVSWICHDDHAQAVRWWNDKYRELKGQPAERRGTAWGAFSNRISRWLGRTRPG
jgi:hypothetical protein